MIYDVHVNKDIVSSSSDIQNHVTDAILLTDLSCQYQKIPPLVITFAQVIRKSFFDE